MGPIAKAIVGALLLIAADQIWFHGRYSDQLWQQIAGRGASFQWQIAYWLRKVP